MAHDTIVVNQSVDIAKEFYELRIHDSAFFYYRKALSCIDSSLDVGAYHTVCYGLCVTFLSNHIYDSSLHYGQRSYNILRFYQGCNDWKIKRYEKAAYILGHIYSICNQYDLALHYYFKGIKYMDTLFLVDSTFDNKFDLSWYYSQIGGVYSQLGRYNRAIKYYTSSIDCQESLSNSSNIYTTFNYLSLAEILIAKGDFYLALVYYQHVLNVYKRHFGQNAIEVSVVYNNIGLVYFNMGEYSKSLNYFNMALNIIIPNRNSSIEVQAGIYNNLADVYRKLNKYTLAEKYFKKALAISDSLYAPSSLEKAFLLNNIGNLYKDLGEYGGALDCYFNSLKIRRDLLGNKHDKIAQIYQNVGLLFLSENNFDSALIYFQKAIIANTYGFNNLDIKANPEHSSLIISKVEMLETLIYKSTTLLRPNSVVSCDRDSLINIAFETDDLAIKISDYLRFEYQNEQSRLRLNSKTQKIYHNAINYLLQQANKKKYLEKTFEYCERSKNYDLFTQLFEQKAKEVGGIPRELIEKEKELRSLRDVYQIKIYQADSNDSIAISGFKKKIFDLSNEYESLVAKRESQYPLPYSRMLHSNIPTVNEIQVALNHNQALLNYYYKDTMLLVAVITNDTFVIFDYVLMESFEDNIIGFIKSINLIRIQKCFDLGYAIYQDLINPIIRYIGSKNELIIVPHGILNYVPFEALISMPVKYHQTTRVPYIINDFCIKYHYSVALWYRGLNENNSSSQVVKYNHDFVGFAPAFFDNGSNDEREHAKGGTINLLSSIKTDNLIAPLPYSSDEVLSICQLFNRHGGATRHFLSHKATEESFKLNIGSAKYVHLATHGQINYSTPCLSGLVFYDHNNNPGSNRNQSSSANANDGILYFNELYDLNINAKLMVVSACESGAGKLEKSEGVMSMTRGLLFAGVNNIIISLFKVPDKHTKELMVVFYQKVILGYSYAKALQLAKLQLIDNNYSFPKLWSSFILVGR